MLAQITDGESPNQSQVDKAQKFVEIAVGEPVVHVKSWTSWHMFRMPDQLLVVVNWNAFDHRFTFQKPTHRAEVGLGLV